MFVHKLGVGEMPGIIYEDNEGAIFLAKNQQVGMRTKHIDIKYHFITAPRYTIVHSFQSQLDAQYNISGITSPLTLIWYLNILIWYFKYSIPY